MTKRYDFGLSTGVKDLHLDQNLTQMALGYRAQGMIADMVFPVVTVAKQSDRYPVWSRKEILSLEDTSRAPGTEAKKLTRSVSSGTYFAKNYALKHALTLEDRENMDPAYYAELVTGVGAYILDKLMLDWDRRVSLLVNSTSNVGSSATVTSAWNGAGNPIGNLNTALDNVKYATGYRANRLLMGAKAWDSLRRDSNVRNIIFGANNGGGYPSRQQVANLFEVEEILIADALYNSANENQAESLATVHPGNVLAYYAPSAPSRENPSFGYSFRWSNGALPNMVAERHPYDTKIKSEEVEVGYYQDEVITAKEYGFLIVAVNSSQ